MDKANVSKLINLVTYQEGSVISRTLLKTPGGNITLFAFDKGQGLSEHTTPFDALVQLLDGEVEISIADDKHTLQTGDTIILPANIPHALKAIKNFKMMLVMLK